MHGAKAAGSPRAGGAEQEWQCRAVEEGELALLWLRGVSVDIANVCIQAVDGGSDGNK